MSLFACDIPGEWKMIRGYSPIYRRYLLRVMGIQYIAKL